MSSVSVQQCPQNTLLCPVQSPPGGVAGRVFGANESEGEHAVLQWAVCVNWGRRSVRCRAAVVTETSSKGVQHVGVIKEAWREVTHR